MTYRDHDRVQAVVPNHQPSTVVKTYFSASTDTNTDKRWFKLENGRKDACTLDDAAPGSNAGQMSPPSDMTAAGVAAWLVRQCTERHRVVATRAAGRPAVPPSLHPLRYRGTLNNPKLSQVHNAPTLRTRFFFFCGTRAGRYYSVEVGVPRRTELHRQCKKYLPPSCTQPPCALPASSCRITNAWNVAYVRTACTVQAYVRTACTVQCAVLSVSHL